MLTAGSAFALFLMLALGALVYWISNRIRFPYTVLLTLLGVFLVPLSSLEPLSFLREFQLTPELLFFIFLPTLLFESAYNMNIRRIVDEIGPITLLAVAGYLASSFLIGGGLWFALNALGMSIPFMVTLLFGALISATDPVAVLALFKEYGAPRRLTLLFEGESLANDATALALFVVVLGLIEHGVSTATAVMGGATFFTMLIGGIAVGLIMGGIFVKLISLFRENEVVAVTLMLVLAHLTYLVAELSNEFTETAGISFLKFSPIIATTVASILMGNYGRFKVSPRADEFIEKFWSQFAFMANSIVFILVGFLFASIPSGAQDLLVPILIAVIIVATSRALSIYGVLVPWNLLAPKEQSVPTHWQHLLAWGSLRGALAIMLVLLIPESLTVPGWGFETSVRDFLLVLTIGCIFATLFIKAPTIGPLIRRFKLDALNPIEAVAELEARAVVHGTALVKLKAFSEKGYVPRDIARDMTERHQGAFKAATETYHREETGALKYAKRALALYVIGYEKEVLKDLFTFQEITEPVYRKIYGKLTIQSEAIEAGRAPNAHTTRDGRDIFENIAAFMGHFKKQRSEKEAALEQLLYYRAQQILARKVIKELTRLQSEFPEPIFDESIVSTLTERYEGYQNDARDKIQAIAREFPDLAKSIGEELAGRSMFRVEEKYLERLLERGMITAKLHIKLRDEYEHGAMREPEKESRG